MKKTFQFQNKKAGFTILFAVLVASIILAVVVSIMNIALKQVLFSGIGRESQFAYYAADTGVECALFWDFRSQELLGGRDIFATSSDSLIASNFGSFSGVAPNVTCGQISIINDGNFIVDHRSNSATTEFQFPIEMPAGTGEDNREYCVRVKVEKEYSNSVERIVTRIRASGYNDDCFLDAPVIFERGLEVTY